MNTIAYLFLFGAAIMIRAVSKGRAENIAEDVSDAFLALVKGDGRAFKEVTNRTGDSLDAPQSEVAAATSGSSGLSGLPTNGAIARAAVKRGSSAKGYSWGKTGPDYYDCSGLMWRACQDAGVYPKGNANRFTTASIRLSKHFTKVTGKPAVDDIVVWAPGVRTGHMGVVTGADKFYSARSKDTGIGYATISTFRKGGSPSYYRAKTGAAGDTAGGGGGGSW